MKWANSLVLDNGLLEIKNTCNELRLISTYTLNDSYATVVANTLASIAMLSTDFTLAGASGLPRTCTSATGKQDLAADASGGGASMHFAFCDSVGSQVLWVTNETSGQNVFIGNTVNFPSLVYTSNQPI